MAEVLRGLPADVAHRLPLDGPPPLEIGQRHRGRAPALPARRWRADAAQDPARVLLDVFLRDASVRAAPLHLVDVDPDFARQASDAGVPARRSRSPSTGAAGLGRFRGPAVRGREGRGIETTF